MFTNKGTDEWMFNNLGSKSRGNLNPLKKRIFREIKEFQLFRINYVKGLFEYTLEKLIGKYNF